MRLIAAIFFSLAVLAMVELVLVVWLWDKVGFINMVLLVFGTGMLGAIIARKNAREAFRALMEGRLPSTGAARQIFDAVAFFIAAALLIIPGIVSDIAGLLLLLPMTRKMLFERYVGKIFPRASASGQDNISAHESFRQTRQVNGDTGQVIDIKAEKVD